MMEEFNVLEDNLITIATEVFRFKRVFEKVVSKLDIDEQRKYSSQFAWFEKKVQKALSDSNLRIVELDGQKYDAGMAVTPINIEEFDAKDTLYIEQTVEPIIMKANSVIKTGTVILGRK